MTKTVELSMGQSVNLSAHGTREGQTAAFPEPIVWTAHGELVTLKPSADNSSCILTAKEAGETMVYASAGELVAVIKVIITPVYADTLEIITGKPYKKEDDNPYKMKL